MNVQEAKGLTISEGEVRTIHDSEGQLLWGKLNYSVEYSGDTTQQTYTGKNLCTSATIAGANTLVFYCAPNNLFTNKTITISVISDSTVSQAIVYIYNGDTSLGEIGRMDLTADQKSSATITLADDIYTAFIGGADGNIRIYKTNSGHDISKTLGEPMIELGSASTSYEPYVGGIPAPNPDYPQTVNVVTGEQTVTVMGKNLFNPNTTTTNKRLDGSGVLIADNSYLTSDYIKVNSSADYTYSRYETGGGSAAVCFFKDDKTFISRTTWFGGLNQAKTNFTFTTSEDTGYVRICDLKTLTTLQVESGSVSSLYEPYQGQSFTVDLGSIELCKMGNIQDCIYKSGDDWYVYKEFGKYTFDGSESIAYNSSNHGFTINPTNLSNYLPNLADPPMVGLSTHFKVNSNTSTWVSNNTIGLSSAGTFWCKAISFATSQQNCETWLTNNTPTVYYLLNTPSSTKITDTTLISQLNAVEEFMTRYGYSSTVSGNLPIIIIRTTLN